uniref:Uncharacterized protein n=1 Tax=Aegilops tauschii subsp. strangulata TaxID=200361 RepID=A0A453FS53_AEGTS
MMQVLGQTHHLVRNRADARGYFAWAFMDLFELLPGY